MPAANVNLSALLEANKKHVTPALGHLQDHIIVKGEGCKVWDEQNKEYIDFTAGIGVTNLGHTHPDVTAAVINQVQQVQHVQCSIAYSVPYLQLIENLLPLMPDKSLDTFFFWNSGAEAIEFAIKLTKRATERPNIICMQGGYHGRTFAASSITRSKTVYTLGSQTMGGVYSTPFPYWHSLGVSPDTPEEELVEMAKVQLELLVKQQVAASDVAAIFCEPVIGEGGYVPAPASWLRFLSEFTKKHGMLLVIDEVQTGFGRTGKMWYSEHVEGFVPDVMTFAKGLANGFPLSGICARREIMEKQEPGTIGGTYAGNPVACAAAVAVTEVFKTQPILDNVNARSAQLFETLHALKASPKTGNLIADVRGKGLMVAIEFRDDAISRKGFTGSVPKDIGKRVQKKVIDQGIIVLTTSCFDTMRFIPPLVITEEEMAFACKAIATAIEEVAREG